MKTILLYRKGGGTVKKAVRMIIGAIYAAAFAIVVGSWGICYAYIERGYIAFGGEYLLSP